MGVAYILILEKASVSVFQVLEAVQLLHSDARISERLKATNLWKVQDFTRLPLVLNPLQRDPYHTSRIKYIYKRNKF